MDIAIQIPVKARTSTRVPNKNFRDLSGKPLSFWLIDELVDHCPEDWDIYIDSEDESTFEFFAKEYGGRLKFHKRHGWFASDAANGNHLIHQFATAHDSYHVFLQAYVTAVTLSGRLITEAVHELTTSLDNYDSMFLVTEETGWFWHGEQPINYQHDMPAGLPRSQDATLLKETTGLYAITREAVFRTGCRIGNNPLLYNVSRDQAFDIDTMEDFEEAQKILNERRARK